MRLLKKIFHNQTLNLAGRTISREAVRGIIVNGETLLMIYSRLNGNYKFPGGGIEAGENYESALIREIREESGANVIAVMGPFGKVIEYDLPLEPEYDVFRMTSSYYLCKVDVRWGYNN